MIDAAKLRRNVVETATRLALNPSAGIVRPSVSTRLAADQRVVVEFRQMDRPFRFECDEPVELGGTGERPSPIRYFLAGVACCQQVWYAKGAALAGCRIDGVQIDLEAELDLRGQHDVPGARPGPERLLLTARINSPDPAELVLAMVDEADSRCPLFDVVRRAMTIDETVILNDEVILERVLQPSVAGADASHTETLM